MIPTETFRTTSRVAAAFISLLLAASVFAADGGDKKSPDIAGAAQNGSASIETVDSRGPTKKLIEWGWDEPDTQFLRKHVAKMEQIGFDGLVFHINSSRRGNLTWQIWGEHQFELDEFRHAIDNLQATKFQRFTELFLRVNVTPGSVDWFDDDAWNRVLHNFQVAATVAKQGGCTGFMFDVEQYQTKLFQYVPSESFTREQLQQKIRERGRQWMTAVNRNFPDITILLTFGYSITQPKPSGDSDEETVESKYVLLKHFFDGMLDACSPQTSIVDAWEPSYSYQREDQFQTAYKTITVEALNWTDNPEKYRKQMSAGFGIWMDYDWRKNGWQLKEFSKNHFTPREFEHSVRAALGRSDRYVWIYTEQPRWWTNEKLPRAYIDALNNARQR